MTGGRPSIRGVIFDLDGTLIDSLEDIALSMNAALETMGYAPHPIDNYRYYVGEGIQHLVECAIPLEHRQPDDVDRFLTYYRKVYRTSWHQRTEVYPGIAGVLDRCRQAGLHIGVLSNKPHDITLDCVRHFLPHWPWSPVYGQRDEVPRKPDPTVALDIAADWALPPQAIAFVGDTAVDMDTARHAGMRAVGVTWGFRPEQELREHQADFIAGDTDQLWEAIVS